MIYIIIVNLEKSYYVKWKNETIKSLIKNNMPKEDIIKFAQISKEELDEIKSMGK